MGHTKKLCPQNSSNSKRRAEAEDEEASKAEVVVASKAEVEDTKVTGEAVFEEIEVETGVTGEEAEVVPSWSCGYSDMSKRLKDRLRKPAL